MKQTEINLFQRMSRLDQLRTLVKDRIRNEGYTLEQFKKDYYVSESDCKDFELIAKEVKLRV